MKKTSFTTLVTAVTLLLTQSAVNAAPPSNTLLADEFKVYQNAKVGLSTKAFKGGVEKTVPTNNEYKENPGCYIACYSKNATDAAYNVADKIYMMGQIRVAGQYSNGLCIPKGFANRDVRHAKEFKENCEKSFPQQCEKGSCWADQHTGNWFY